MSSDAETALGLSAEEVHAVRVHAQATLVFQYAVHHRQRLLGRSLACGTVRVHTGKLRYFSEPTALELFCALNCESHSDDPSMPLECWSARSK